ncbi:gliding motility lipoprotein GldB [Fulvivirgaceae bacterium BMA10]|uniref:Gliding motility lipoprotein GldB n=1 Tax=Splendidivirga corallicola TaxID=3051826 RepID=A0ABT8KXS2_9BACT|nr:gliding motility lipoprotein GldB [Fulvivirgaceae bacterium BMA10]
MIKNALWVVLLLIGLFSCTNDQCKEIDVSSIDLDLHVERLEDPFFLAKNDVDMTKFLKEHVTLSEAFYQRSQYPHDSILVNKLVKLSNDPFLDTLYQETRKVYGDFGKQKKQYTTAFKMMKHYYPEFNPPKIKTIVTGIGDGNDLYISNDEIIIGLDWFLANDGSYKPLGVPQYILNRLTKEHLVPSSVMFLSDQFNKTDLHDKSMLAEMIYYGKAYEFTKRMMPCIPDSLIIGYSKEEIDGAFANQETIWAHFLDNSLLYETNHFVKTKFISERPNVPEIGNECPGRIGQWLGWEIVRRYMENTGASFQELMKEKDAQKIFTRSKYKPKNR